MAEENIEGQGLYAEEKKPAALNPLYAKIVEHVCAAISIVLDFICFFVGIILFVLMMYSGQIFSNPINENCSKTNIQQYLVVMSVCHFIQCAVSTISLLIFLFEDILRKKRDATEQKHIGTGIACLRIPTAIAYVIGALLLLFWSIQPDCLSSGANVPLIYVNILFVFVSCGAGLLSFISGAVIVLFGAFRSIQHDLFACIKNPKLLVDAVKAKFIPKGN